MKDGLGNWQEAATHIGTRTKEDCETHYNAVYLGVGPDGKELDHVWENTQENGQGHVDGPPRKKRRRDFMPVRICIFSCTRADILADGHGYQG
jgi:transcriptional adapter 2-alpha